MQYVRLEAGSDGESHFEQAAVGLASTVDALAIPAFSASDWHAADRIRFLSFPPDWRGEAHLTPRRQFLVWLSGSTGIQASDGEVRHFNVGDVLLAEDTSGKGHSSWNAGQDALLVAAIQVPD
jgi:hypothetical protein